MAVVDGSLAVAGDRVLLGELDDERLAALASVGGERAFGVLAGRWRPRLLRCCERVTGDRGLAEDAAQVALWRAWRALPSRDADSGLVGWLLAIAHNCAVDQLRARRDWPNESLELTVPAGRGTEAEALTRIRAASVLGDMAGLPARQREVLWLREGRGLPYSEIAGRLGISERAARRASQTARITLNSVRLGRELPCGVARAVLTSSRPGRRPVVLLSHLRACPDCRALLAGVPAPKRAVA